MPPANSPSNDGEVAGCSSDQISPPSDAPDDHDDTIAGNLELVHLSDSEIAEIVIHIEGEDAILVGGQALNIWAEWLYDRVPDALSAYAPYTSKDLDYFGSQYVATEFARRIDGKVNLVGFDTHSVSTATVTFWRNGRLIVVDFLGSLRGVPVGKIAQGSVEVPLSVNGEDAPAVVANVLHPVLVLQSRIGNVAGLGRRDTGTIRQLHAAFIIAQEYILSRLEDGGEDAIDDAQQSVRDICDLVRTSFADAVFEEYGLDAISVLRTVANHPGWHPLFNERQVLGAIERLHADRERRLSERARRLARRGS